MKKDQEVAVFSVD